MILICTGLPKECPRGRKGQLSFCGAGFQAKYFVTKKMNVVTKTGFIKMFFIEANKLEENKQVKTQQQSLDQILHIKADNTLGFGCCSKIDGRQDSIIVAFNMSWQTQHNDLDGILLMTQKNQ